MTVRKIKRHGALKQSEKRTAVSNAVGRLALGDIGTNVVDFARYLVGENYRC